VSWFLKSKDKMPKVVVIEKNTSVWKFQKCKTRCKKDCKLKSKDAKKVDVKEVKSTKLCNTIMEAWENMVESSSNESFVEIVVKFWEVYRNFSRFLNYVECYILNPIKEKFALEWTYHVLHLDNTTTNKVESTQVRLKKKLTDSKEDLVRG